MMKGPAEPNTSPTGPKSTGTGTTVPERKNLLTLLEAASSLDYVQINDSDGTVNNSRAIQTAGEPSSASTSYTSSSFLSFKTKSKNRPKKKSNSGGGSGSINKAPRPAANLTLTQLLAPSNASPKSSKAPSTKAEKKQKKTKKTKKPTKPTFPEELMRMVTDESNTSIITFLPCGKQFIILDQDAFLNDVLPKSPLAMQTPSGGLPGKVKISSVTRRLNRWGFLQCRVKGLENYLVFAHPKFDRDAPDLCKEIKSGFISTAAKVKVLHKALPKSAPAYRCLPANVKAEAEAKTTSSTASANSDPRTPVNVTPVPFASAASAVSRTVPALPGNVYNRPVIKVEGTAIQSAGTSLTLPFQQPTAASTAAAYQPVRSQSTHNLKRELILQTQYARLLRLQSNLQRKAVTSTFFLPVNTAETAAYTANSSTFLPHGAVMAATHTVTAGAMDTIQRGRAMFGESTGPASVPQAEVPKMSHQAMVREEIKRALIVALNSQHLQYNTRAA